MPFMVSRPTSFSLSPFLSYFSVLRSLHECGWVHRDISSGNVLVVDDKVVLSDVEYTKHTSDISLHSVRTVCYNLSFNPGFVLLTCRAGDGLFHACRG